MKWVILRPFPRVSFSGQLLSLRDIRLCSHICSAFQELSCAVGIPGNIDKMAASDASVSCEIKIKLGILGPK